MNETFGQRLRRLRRATGNDQRQFALLLGCTHTAVSFWERDERRPKHWYIERMSRLFRVTQHYLLYGCEDAMLTRDDAA